MVHPMKRVSQPRAEHHGDDDRLTVLLAAFEDVRRDDVVPIVALTDARVSSAARGWFGEPPRMWISRAAIDAGADEMRGHLGHEYSHLLDP